MMQWGSWDPSGPSAEVQWVSYSVNLLRSMHGMNACVHGVGVPDLTVHHVDGWKITCHIIIIYDYNFRPIETNKSSSIV